MATSDSSNSRHGYDPHGAFQRRRQIYRGVQKIQRQEHEAVKRIAEATTSGKGELLELLSNWLLAQRVRDRCHDEVESLTGCPLDAWLTLQLEAERLEKSLAEAQREWGAAKTAYDSVAPLGFVSEWFAEAEERARLQELKTARQEKTAARDAARSRLDANIARRRDFAGRFLRACLSNVQQLGNSAVLGDRVQSVVSRMTRTIEREWSAHLRANASLLCLMQADLDQLRNSYRPSGAP